jgi:hypothetical protein
VRQSIVVCLLLLTFELSASAKSWRGIVPLRSTRADVEKILGKPSTSNHVYKIGAGTVDVTYSQQRCEQSAPSGWGSWNVPSDTVINLSFDADFLVSDLKIRNLEKYKLGTDSSLIAEYRLPVEGIQYSVKGDRVVRITYGPTDKDKNLRCAKSGR